MKLINIIFLFFVPGLFLSQFNSEFLKYSDYGRHVSAYGDFELGSSCINNEFIKRIYFGGYIDNEIKDNVSSEMQSINRFGGGVSFGLNYFSGNDSSKYDWMIGIKNQEVINGSFSRDFFNTLFFGNKMYKGSTAYFNNTGLNYIGFQELKAGLIWKNVDKGGKIGFGLSLLKGQSLVRYREIDTNFLATSLDAEQLSYNASFSLAVSDTGNRDISAFNGTGLSADLYFEAPYKSKIGPSRFIVTVNNLGFIRWNKKTMLYTIDSLLTFNGVNIDNLLVLNDSTLNIVSQDTLINNLTSLKREKVNVNLPMNLLFMHQTEFSKNYTLRFGIRNIFNGNSTPFFFIENKINIKNKFLLGISIAYGGYNKYSAGAYFEYNNKYFTTRIGSIALQGFLRPEKTLGQSLYLTFAKKFK
ncbi:MAG: DUF5723 family protein [Bacteroidota bacterium]